MTVNNWLFTFPQIFTLHSTKSFKFRAQTSYECITIAIEVTFSVKWYSHHVQNQKPNFFFNISPRYGVGRKLRTSSSHDFFNLASQDPSGRLPRDASPWTVQANFFKHPVEASGHKNQCKNLLKCLLESLWVCLYN